MQEISWGKPGRNEKAGGGRRAGSPQAQWCGHAIVS
jgi:hypothetical protein